MTYCGFDPVGNLGMQSTHRKSIPQWLATMLLLLLIGVVSPHSGMALSMLPVNLAKIVKYTENAIVGTVISSTAIETPQGWADKIEVLVTEPVFGSARTGQTLTWYQARSSEQAPLSGMPRFEPGSIHLVFLAAKAPASLFQSPFALGQGSFVLSHDPATGETVARNDFMNASLFDGLDILAIAKAAAAREPGAAKLSLDARATKASQLHQRLAPGRSGATSLEALKLAAQTLKSSSDPEQTFARNGAAANAGQAQQH